MQQLKTLITVFLVMFALGASHAADENYGLLQGTVVDAGEHAPINRGVFILAHSFKLSDQNISVDERGKFSIRLRSGFYDVFVFSPAFEPVCKTIEIRPNQTTVYKVVMKINQLTTFPD